MLVRILSSCIGCYDEMSSDNSKEAEMKEVHVEVNNQEQKETGIEEKKREKESYGQTTRREGG